MWKSFKEFIMRGSVVDLAVGIIIGSAFTAVVSSLVNDVLMPPVGLLLGSVDFAHLFAVLKAGEPGGPYQTLTAAQDAGAVTINYGLFINHIISFLIVGFATFLIVRGVNKLYLDKQRETEAPAEATTKSCPYCKQTIPIEAVRCPFCTSQLGAAEEM
jgi:large conductance mechanosensitive channel